MLSRWRWIPSPYISNGPRDNTPRNICGASTTSWEPLHEPITNHDDDNDKECSSSGPTSVARNDDDSTLLCFFLRLEKFGFFFFFSSMFHGNLILSRRAIIYIHLREATQLFIWESIQVPLRFIMIVRFSNFCVILMYPRILIVFFLRCLSVPDFLSLLLTTFSVGFLSILGI